MAKTRTRSKNSSVQVTFFSAVSVCWGVSVTPLTLPYSGLGRPRPQVDVALGGDLVDLGQLVRPELELVQRVEVGIQLGHAARPDHQARHPLVAQGPDQRQ